MKLDFWLLWGFLGQAVFASRFIVQWLASERAKKSVIPIAFWLLSLGGSFMLLTYAIHIKDPIFILGQSTGFLIYIRNLTLIYKEKQAQNG
ncbi:MAG: lipid-A-disaccharide synthase N-terminal domain-containing protein [Firmicutes bacterium]|nr:lipid-A-disaccharide synthase N-terminal domain-containing protein [Bacillota bacterium]